MQATMQPPSAELEAPPRHRAAVGSERSIARAACPAERAGRQLEPRGGAEADELLVVEGLLEQGLGDIEPQRSERRVPHDAEARPRHVRQLVSARQTPDWLRQVGRSAAALQVVVFLASAPAPNSEPASAKTAPLMPRSSGMSGNGKRTSAVVAQNVSPPSASPVSVSRGPKARPVEAADGLAALVEEVDQADILAAPARDVAADRAPDQRDLFRYGIVEASLRRSVRMYCTSPPRPANSTPVCRK